MFTVGIECRRAARLEVPGIDPRPFTRHQKHELVEVGELQRGVQKDVCHLHQPVLHAALEVEFLHSGGELIEALVGDRIQQAGAVRIVTIDGHGGNADPFRDGAHRDCCEPFPVKKFSRGHEDSSGGAWLWCGGLG